ncbi:MAG: F0F1 ATP synthase subunit delta [Gammaproteobacteria bacterium]
MLIDWFTVFAQLVNFLILMALLKHFLYKPILQALDNREKKIAGQLEEARKSKADAERERNEYVHKNERFDQQRADLLKQAQNDAEHEREKLLEAARAEVDKQREGWQQALQIERFSLHRDLMRQTQNQVFAITRKVLADLASESLEQGIVEAFIRRLHVVNESEKNRLTLAIQATSNPVVVRSAFELTPEQQSALNRAVRSVLAAEADIEFEAADELIGGIELSTNGHKLSWNIADYLASLEHSLDRALAGDSLASAESGGDGHAAG